MITKYNGDVYTINVRPVGNRNIHLFQSEELSSLLNLSVLGPNAARMVEQEKLDLIKLGISDLPQICTKLGVDIHPDAISWYVRNSQPFNPGKATNSEIEIWTIEPAISKRSIVEGVLKALRFLIEYYSNKCVCAYTNVKFDYSNPESSYYMSPDHTIPGLRKYGDGYLSLSPVKFVTKKANLMKGPTPWGIWNFGCERIAITREIEIFESFISEHVRPDARASSKYKKKTLPV